MGSPSGRCAPPYRRQSPRNLGVQAPEDQERGRRAESTKGSEKRGLLAPGKRRVSMARGMGYKHLRWRGAGGRSNSNPGH